MNENVPGGRRRLDGPIRRSTPQQLDAAKVAPVPQAPSRPLNVIPKATPPTGDFSYRTNTLKKPKVRKRRLRLWAGLIILLIVLSIGGFIGLKLVLATSKIITKKGNGAPVLTSAVVDPSKLKHEGDGRVNILVLGIGGGTHDGGNLSDTMLVMSIDPKTKDVVMLDPKRFVCEDPWKRLWKNQFSQCRWRASTCRTGRIIGHWSTNSLLYSTGF
jgi:hypothetical protein